MEYSFWKLISKYEIVIPAIQREYAQGRKSEYRIAFPLVKDLYEAVTSKKKMNLLFIYGKTEEQHLIPLDGQQRLTTLFLLHWFLSIGFICEDDKKFLTKFFYKTRPSSEDFCYKLINESIEFKSEKKVSDLIMESKWFFLSWNANPTISAMLNMLDIIQDYFKHPDIELFNNLKSVDCPIKFHFLPLDRFKLDDKIYIKMNSRGKPLTDFENFKANISVLFDEKCKSKFDNEWLDIFWEFEKSNEEVSIKEVDRMYLNLIKNATINFYVEKNNIDSKFIDNFNIFDSYKEVYFSGSEYLEYLSIVLDCLVSYNDKKKYFENIIKDKPSYWERLRFYAVMCFIISQKGIFDFDSEKYKNWIRVCENLINNNLVQSPDEFYRAIRSIKKLSENIKDLYIYLSNPESKIDGFLSKQIEEEKIKAALILQNIDWEARILIAEQHEYFSGQIGFILEYSKIEEKYNLELFNNYSDKLQKLYGNEYREKYNCLFQRALFALGDYLVPINSCLTFCTFNTGLREKMDNWRKVFDDKNKNSILKILLDSIELDNINHGLQSIIDNYTETDWKCLFIKISEVIEYCESYRVAKWTWVNKIALSRSSAAFWRRHAELYSYVLYLKLKKNGQIVCYQDTSDYPSYIQILWKDKWYYIQEENTGYLYGFLYDNTDTVGLEEMKCYVENIIELNNLQKTSP